MTDINKPITNPELVDAMNKFLNDKTEENELILIEKVIQAHYLLPVIIEGKIENGVLQEETTISFKTLTNTAEETFLLAFTDWEELAKWSKKKEETLVSAYEDIKSILKDTDKIKGFVINPYGQNYIITRSLIQYFSQKMH